jgi:hypothetical protein
MISLFALLLCLLGLTPILSCAGAPMKTTITIEGEAARSKAGIVVDGTIITCLSEEVMDSVQGKRIRVSGILSIDHPWRNTFNDEGEAVQGFAGPAMTSVISLEILEP